MNIYLHELKGKIRSILTWTLADVLLLLVFMSIFQGFSKDTALVNDLMKQFPRELLLAFGMEDMDWSSITGYFGMLFVFVQICLAVQAANYGFGLVSVEESEWTADFLLSKPVGRGHILTAKLLAALTSLAVTQAILWVGSFILLNLYKGDQTFDNKPVVLLLVSMVLFQLFFFAVGMAISLLMKRVRSVTPLSMALVFGLYIMNAFGSMIGEKSLEVLSPFKQFAPSYIVRHGGWDASLSWISPPIILIAVIASYILYSRRNIATPV